MCWRNCRIVQGAKLHVIRIRKMFIPSVGKLWETDDREGTSKFHLSTWQNINGTLIWQFRQKICMFESLTMLDLVRCFDGDSVVVHKRETHLKWRHEILKTKFSLYSTKIFREMWKLLHLCHKQACTRYRDLV